MMKNDQFVYVTYIRTTPRNCGRATEPEFTRKFWCNNSGIRMETGFVRKIMAPDGMLTDSGEVSKSAASTARSEMAQ